MNIRILRTKSFTMSRLLLLICLAFSVPVIAQQGNAQQNSTASDTFMDFLEFREVGPWRGGRSTAVTGHPERRETFYFGSTGGGVWKSDDGGSNWNNISDGDFGGSIGSIALAPSDPDIIYVGAGENSLRGNVSSGFGVWKSLNGGRTWENKGLKDSRHILRMVVHPKNPDIVYCAALGHLYGPNTQRGIYKSTNGGDTWTRILYVSDSVGACDLVMDPGEPNILLATFWNVRRTPYSLESGGPGSGIWKTTDAGASWTDITRNEGLPKDTLGIIGVSISAADPNRYFAIVEAKNGGVFRSDDAGLTWQKMNTESDLRQRAWYYSKIFTDPTDKNTLYVLNVQFWKSTDGGKTFRDIRTPHGDHHDLWIDPKDPKRMIIGDDGGAQVSFNGGDSWSTYYNQPTAQFYRVSTDNHVPYRILGAQQDNTSIRIAHRSKSGQIDRDDWEPTAGFESGFIVADPLDPDIVYGGNYSGFIGCLNHRTGDRRNITVWPDDPIGQGADVQRYRFQWNFPLFFSPHNPKKLYTAGNELFYTTDGGTSWTSISPDLTTNDKTRQQPSGGIITKDNTGVEVYCTIFAAMESPQEEGVILAGTDDGLVHITRDGGAAWKNITPKDLPAWTQINSVEFDPHVKGGIFIVGTRYKSDDYTPYIFYSADYGATWSRRTNGIAPDHFCRVLRADQSVKGLLYSGTEYGLYISNDYGKNWRMLKGNLPEMPITDMTIKENDLIIATQGRGFWIMDNLAVLQDWATGWDMTSLHVFRPEDAWLIDGWQNEHPVNAGMNPKQGATLYYFLPETSDSMHVRIEVLDADGEIIRGYDSQSEKEMEKINPKKGLNVCAWNMQYPPSPKAEDMFLWNGTPGGPDAPPGNYAFRFITEEDTAVYTFTLKADPGSAATPQEMRERFEFLLQVQQKFDTTQKAIGDIQKARKQINGYLELLGEQASPALKDTAKAIIDRMTVIENVLYETRNKSSQDMLNYGIKLNDKLAGVYNTAAHGNFRPSLQTKAVYTELAGRIDEQLTLLQEILSTDIDRFNQMIHNQALPVIIINL